MSDDPPAFGPDHHSVRLRAPGGTDPRLAVAAVFDEFLLSDPTVSDEVKRAHLARRQIEGRRQELTRSTKRICVLPADEGGCGYLRLIFAAQLMAFNGMNVTAQKPGNVTAFKYQAFGGQVRLTEQPEFDVLVLQRPTSILWPKAIVALQEAGVRVVVDLDDDVMSISPKHPAWRETHPKYSPLDNRDHLRASLRLADQVVVTTEGLQDRYGGVIVRNAIPESYLTEERPERDGPLWVGWTGAVWTHPDDLDVTRGGVARAVEATGAQFVSIGSPVGVAKGLRLRTEPIDLGAASITGYPKLVVQLNVGIAPLAETGFNMLGKSFLKPLDYAALGVPFVCSPSDAYRAFVAEGVGFLARRGSDWETHVHRLLSSASLRAEQAEAGRKVAAGHTIERRWPEFAAAWLGSVA